MGRGRAPCCAKVGLNKGSWTPEEDTRLVVYIKKHGHENWRALPKQAGLLRCGKSCRLRWINYLRPDIKRGNFTVDEEEAIIKLHGALGNKWSKIASYLPGRTDNEIKNVWNTHLKKRVESKEKKTSLLSSPSSSTSISYSEQCEGDNKNEPVPNENIELQIELQKSESNNTGLWAGNPEPSNGSPSSSLSDSFTSSNDEMDLFEEMLNIQVESELEENFLELFSSEAGSFEDQGSHWNFQGESNGGPMESKGWLENLEKELELEGESEVSPQWTEMEGDPVSNYFQTSLPTSRWPLDLLHVDPF